MGLKSDLASCVRDMYQLGLTTSVSGNQSVRTGEWIWITPSAVPRYDMRASDLVRVCALSGKAMGNRRPSIETELHVRIYQACPQINAIIHTHSPFTIAVSISEEFPHVIEEARLVVGTPSVIPNSPSGSSELARAVAAEFAKGVAAVVVKNHGVVAAAASLPGARAIIESLEEWSKILIPSRVLGGPKALLESD